MWMNEWEIDDAVERWSGDPDLGAAVRTLDNLRWWANSHSDGWHAWPKPGRAAGKLMIMIEAVRWPESDPRYIKPTPAALKAALAPVKAFRTRMIAKMGDAGDFMITDRMPTRRETLSREITDAERTAREHATLADRWLARARDLMAELAELPADET